MCVVLLLQWWVVCVCVGVVLSHHTNCACSNIPVCVGVLLWQSLGDSLPTCLWCGLHHMHHKCGTLSPSLPLEAHTTFLSQYCSTFVPVHGVNQKRPSVQGRVSYPPLHIGAP